MELILWRHAEAVDGLPDMERCLTGKGVKQAQRMAGFLRSRLPHGARMLVSPAKRAQQTAHALTRHFITEPSLAPNCSVKSLLNAANWPDGDGCVLIVGHQPVLGEAAALLLCDSHAGFSVKKGAVWWLARHAQEGDYQPHLRLVIAPDLL